MTGNFPGRRAAFAPFLAIIMALGLAGAPALADDTLDRGIGSEWSSLDPQVNFDAAAGWIQADAYEGLVTFSADGQILPGAAESWQASEDGKTYTFHLRPGLKWSNGDALVAQDFVNGVLRTLEPQDRIGKGLLLLLHHQGQRRQRAGQCRDQGRLRVRDDRPRCADRGGGNADAGPAYSGSDGVFPGGAAA